MRGRFNALAVVGGILLAAVLLAVLNVVMKDSTVEVEQQQVVEPKVVIQTLTPEQGQTQPGTEQGAEQANGVGDVTVTEVSGTAGMPVGANISFAIAQDVYTGTTFTPEKLPGISILPQMPFTGRWASTQLFEVRWQQPKGDASEVAMAVTELPGKAKAIPVVTGQDGPYTFSAKPLQLNGFLLVEFQPNSKATLRLIWDNPVPSSELKGRITLKMLRPGKHQWEEFDNNQISIQQEQVNSQAIVIRDRRIKGGEKIELSVEGNRTSSGRYITYSADNTVNLQEPAKIEIGQVSPVEGSDFFTINVQFYVRGGNQNYSSDRGRIDVTTAKNSISVSPAVDFEVVPGLGSFRLIGAFKPRTQYTVEFKPGLHGTENQWLTKETARKVKTPAFNPKLNFMSKARYLPRLDGAELPFEYRNVDSARIAFRRVPPQNLVFWMTQNQESASAQVSEEVLSKDMRLEMQDDRKERGVIDLSDLSSAGKGVFQVSLSRLYGDKKQNAAHMDSALIVVTDLAAVAKQDGDDLYVWTRSASDFEARKNVDIKVMSYNNFEIASCTTGGDGGCLLKGLMKQPKKPYALIMSSNDDLSYMRFSDVALPNGDKQDGMRSYGDKATALEAYIYSSRGVYRPGETVNLASVVWSGERMAAKGVPLQWKILSPRQKVVREVSIHSSDFGMSTLDFRLDDYAGTGKYQAVLSSGDKQLNTYGFFVEEFVPERIGLKVTPEKKLVIGNAPARFEADAKYLFGPAVSGGKYQARFSIKPAWYTVPGHKDFSTGEYRIAKQAPIVLQPQSGKLDANGLARLDVSVDGMRSSFPTVMSLEASVDVTESGSGRVTHRSASTLISPHDEIIGLRNMKAEGGDIQVEGKLFTPAGDEVRRDMQVEISLLQIYSNWTYAWNPQTGYNTWQQEEVLLPEGKGVVVAVKNGRFETVLHTNNSWGRYVVRAQSVDGQQISDMVVSMGYSWYWSGRGDEAAKPRAPDQVQLVPSVKEANAGDKVTFSFEAPFAGHALFAIEADKVLESRWIKVKKGPNTIETTAPEFLPNVYATLLIIKDPREGEMYVPARAWGNVSLKIIPERFQLDLKADMPGEMRPGHDLVVKLNVQNGKKAEYTVAVVDEGILQLTRFKTPKPLNYFFEPRRLGVSTFETIGWTFPRTMKTGRGVTGGGEADAAKSKSSRVIPVRLVSHWSGVVASDGNGKAEIKVPIPPFQGKVRVMVVAAQDGKVGHSEQFVTVRDPLVMQPTLPRFLQWGDDFEIPVFVVNMTGKKQTVTANVNASGGVMLSKKTLSVTLPEMGSTTLLFPAKVSAFDGKVSFKFKAKAGDTETVDDATLPILPLSPEQTVNITLPAGNSFKLSDHLPGDMRSEGLKVFMAASPIPYISELKRLRYLIHYPYGCIEQTTSSTMPLLYIGKVLSVVDPKALEGRDIEDMVYSGLNRLLSMQTISGGFAYWPGGSEPVLWGTAYATHLLLKAKELGYEVPESALNDALNFMQEALTSRRHQWSDSHYYYGDSEPYMTYVLGLAGRHQKSTIRRLVDNGKWTGGRMVENRFLIMLAAHMAGEKELVERISKGDDLFSILDVGKRDYTGSYWSSYRTDAMRLSLAADVWPEDPRLDALTHKVAKRLATERYLNTQETAWSISALGKIAGRYQGASTEGVSLLAGGKQVEPNYKDNGILGWNFYGDQLSVDQVVKLKYKSDKPPFLYATITGYNKSLAPPAASTKALDVKRTYLSLAGKSIDPQAIKQGELMVVKLSIQNRLGWRVENIALTDRLPAGFEVENPNLGRSDDMSWIDEGSMFKPAYVNRRDDRVDIFGDLGYSEENHWLNYYYIVRAVSNGRFTAAPAKLEAMYEPEKHVYSSYDKIRIQAP